MEEERLTRLLRALPRERARGGFTGRVLRRLEAEDEAGSRLQPTRIHRLMLASATVAAIAVSVALLPREHTPLPVNVTLPAPVRIAEARSPLDGSHRLATRHIGVQQAMSRPAADFDPAQARQVLQELRQERTRIERELRSLQQPVVRRAGPPADLYLGGDENVDLVLSGSRARAVQVTPPADRDDGEYENDFLD